MNLILGEEEGRRLSTFQAQDLPTPAQVETLEMRGIGQ